MANNKYLVSFKITSTLKGFVPVEGELTSEQKEGLHPSYCDGQIIFVEDLGKIYLDFHNKRTCYSVDALPSTGGLNYIGISTIDPLTATNGIVKIDGENVTPNLKDVVVYGKKEYMWRKGTDGVIGWYEIGDEDVEELTWEEN